LRVPGRTESCRQILSRQCRQSARRPHPRPEGLVWIIPFYRSPSGSSKLSGLQRQKLQAFQACGELNLSAAKSFAKSFEQLGFAFMMLLDRISRFVSGRTGHRLI